MNGLYQPQSSDEEALRTVLRESGLYPEEQLQALNRDQLRGQYQQYMEQHPQTLLLIDDPADNTPLKALLPLPGCGLVIIARPGGALRQSLPGHRQVLLKPLDKIQARAVLQKYWTKHFDAAVADQICALCGYVPLALVMAAGTIQSEQGDDPQPARVAQRFANQLAAEAGKRPGLASQFFQKFTAGGQAEANRKDIQTVLSLSYNLLTEPAQQLFRALPTFGRLPFTAPAALAVAALDPAEQEPAFNQLRERGLIRKVESDTDSHPEYYQMYDLLYEYARHEQSRPAHQQEMRPCLERYLDYYIQYVADCSAAFQPGSLTALSQFAAEAAHISTCFVTLLDEPLTDADGQLLMPDNAVRGLKLVAPALPLLQAGLQVPELAQDENTLLFKPDTYAHWQAAGQKAVRQVYAELSVQRQQQATIMRMFVDWFDAAAAQQIAQASQDDLDELLRIDYLQQRAADQRYCIRWQLVTDFLQKQVDYLPPARHREVHAAYATLYADRAKEYRQQLSLFAQDIAHIRHGQHLAAHASPPLDTALIAYARWSFWYFDQQREYSTLADWIRTGCAAAERQNDPAIQATLTFNLGLIYKRQGDLDAAARHYHQVYDGDLSAHADPATRANACHGMGVVHDRRDELEAAARYYHQVYDGDLSAHADPATRASACHGLGFIHERQDDLDAAARYYHQVYDGDLHALADPATRANACYGLGFIHERQGDLDDAVRYYHQVYDGDLSAHADPATCARACYGLGFIHELQGDQNRAEHYYHLVYEGDLSTGASADTRASACHGLGVVQWQKNSDQALRYFNQAIALNPGLAAAYRYRGLVHERLHKLADALVDARQALALDPRLIKAREDIQRYEQKLVQR